MKKSICLFTMLVFGLVYMQAFIGTVTYDSTCNTVTRWDLFTNCVNTANDLTTAYLRDASYVRQQPTEVIALVDQYRWVNTSTIFSPSTYTASSFGFVRRVLNYGQHQFIFLVDQQRNVVLRAYFRRGYISKR